MSLRLPAATLASDVTPARPASRVRAGREVRLGVARAWGGLLTAGGEQSSPSSMAFLTGRRQERDTNQRRAQGRALGAGATSRQFSQDDPSDPIRDELRAQIAQLNQDELPVSNLLRR